MNPKKISSQNSTSSQLRTLLELERIFVGDDIFFEACTSEKKDFSRETALLELKKRVSDCTQCSLCSTRKTVVFGEGSFQAKLMFIGEAPGQKEDETGRPFVGRAGVLLDKMIVSMGLKRDNVFIANVVKCRPPENRNPEDGEIEKCFPFLKKQIELVSPKIICTLGHFAAKTLLKDTRPMGKLRGNIFSFSGIDLIPTFHPAYLLRNPSMKKVAWQDLQLVMKSLKNFENSLLV